MIDVHEGVLRWLGHHLHCVALMSANAVITELINFEHRERH